MDRRSFLRLSPLAGLGALAACRVSAPARPATVGSIEHEVLWNGRAGEATWFHPRPCALPDGGVLMTLQPIYGSDYYGQVHWTRSDDLGHSWREPEPIEGFGWVEVGDDYSEGVCDVVPQYHARSGTVLAMGHNVFYSGGRLARQQRARFPVYVTGDGAGSWSQRHTLAWEHPGADRIYTCGCADRLFLDDGDLLIPISYGSTDRTDRLVTTLLCSFDGERVEVRETGSSLQLAVRRGLLEPSLASCRGRIHMTIRAEDGHGYVATCRDGLAWTGMEPWRFDDGEPLVMSTTQQHWLVRGDDLFLVYTRRDRTNAEVMRYRAPLYIAAVDQTTMTLRRATERVVLPLRGDPANAPKDVARMGNFHTLDLSPEEAWVTVCEARPTAAWRGDVLLARIRWSRRQT